MALGMQLGTQDWGGQKSQLVLPTSHRITKALGVTFYKGEIIFRIGINFPTCIPIF